MGRALRGGYRDRVFLMTKIDGRDRRSAAEQIGESLRRLQTDTIDLLQFTKLFTPVIRNGFLPGVVPWRQYLKHKTRGRSLYRVHRA